MSNWTKFLIVFDNHGNRKDIASVEAMFKFKEQYWKPDECIHGGDNWNFAAIRKGASEEEKAESMEEDFNDGMEFMKRLHPKYVTYGNHDYRIFDLALHGKGLVGDYARQCSNTITGEMHKMKCKTFPYDSRFGILHYANNLNVAHGYYHNEHSATSMAYSYGNVVFGHTHAFLSGRVKSLDVRRGQGIGCLCDLDMDFEHARTAKLKKSHGFCYGVKNKCTNLAHYWTAEKEEDGTWILPTDYVTL
jgi:predicted phosphodiesterase